MVITGRMELLDLWIHQPHFFRSPIPWHSRGALRNVATGGFPSFIPCIAEIQFHQIIYINGFKWYTTYTTYPEVAINRGIKHCWLAQTNLSIRLMFTALPWPEGRRTHLLGNILPWNDGSLWLVVSASLVGEKHSVGAMCVLKLLCAAAPLQSVRARYAFSATAPLRCC